MDRLEQLAAHLRSTLSSTPSTTTPSILCVECDVSNPQHRSDLAKKALEFSKTVPGSMGLIHRVFLNQGISQNSKFIDLAESTESEMFDVNFFANTALTRLFLPILESGVALTRGKNAVLKPRLAYVASGLARLPAPLNTIYCASKAALATFMDSLRYEVSFGITGILPGPVRTEIIGKLRGPAGKIVTMVVDDPSVVSRVSQRGNTNTTEKDNSKLPESVMMSPLEAARLAALAVERGVREVTYPPLDRAMAKIRYGNSQEGQAAWDGPKSVGDTMTRMYSVPTTPTSSSSKL